jgi:tripartite-type tricarboxylate transporter receptor subunit TctC
MMKSVCVAACLAAIAAASPCNAQSYPTGTVRIIVPYPAGGPTDVMARLLAQKLSEGLGQQFIVENRPGASGTTGTLAVANAAPDGYTLLIGTPDFALQPVVKAKPPYDAVKQFTPITLAASSTEMIAVNPTVPAKNLQELIALAKANPGKHQFASPGVGTPPHLVGEFLYKITYKVDVIHVPFQGAAPAVNSTIAGHTSILHMTAPSIVPQAKDGKLRPIVVASGRRSFAAPDVPTLAESGVSGFSSDFILVVVAPAATPKTIVDFLNREMVKVLKLPDVKERLTAFGFEPVGSTPEELAAKIRSETEKWSKVVRDANLKID